MDVFAETVIKKVKSEGESPTAWLKENAKHLAYCSVASHVGKYTHPGVQIALCDTSEKQCDGYVTTASVGADKDIVFTSARYMSLASILVKKMRNGKTVLQNFAEDTQLIRDDVTELDVSYEELREKVLQIECPQTAGKTDDRLRQVYFPIGGGEYHLLSLLPSSANMKALTDALTEQNARRMECRNKKSDSYGKTYDDVMNVTRVNFGGARPQNISSLNGKGGMYLLPSIPPLPPKKRLRLPRKNFFHELPWTTRRKEVFARLDKLFRVDRNNMELRTKVLNNIRDIAYDSIFYARRLRETPAGWSAETKLSQAERIWLDDAFLEDRRKDTAWIREISDSFGRWVMKSYERSIKDPILFSDTEMKHFAKLMREILEEEVQNSK